MAPWSSRNGTGPKRALRPGRFQALAATLAVTVSMGVLAPVAQASPGPRGLPGVQMFGYAKGPSQKLGSAAVARITCPRRRRGPRRATSKAITRPSFA